MSCMMMRLEPLAALANAVETRLNYGYDYWGFGAPESLYHELEDCKTPYIYDAKAICRKLYAVNVRAYNGRYGGHEEPIVGDAPVIDGSKYIVHRPPEYREHGFAVRPWHYQLANLLDFWLYQTLEDSTRSDPLRLAMSEFRDSLFRFIVRNSSDYIELLWGELPRSEAENVSQKPIYHINTAAGEAVARKGHAGAPGASRPRWRASSTPI